MKSYVIKKGRLYWDDIDSQWGSLSSVTIWKYADDAQDVMDIEKNIHNKEFENAKVVKVEIHEIKK